MTSNDNNTEISALEQTVIDGLGLTTAAIEPAGNVLKAARESENLSLRDVADKMFLLPNQVEALETGNKGRFRGEFFYKGYLQSYAKLLKLDPQLVLEGYTHDRPTETEANENRNAHQHIQSPIKGRNIKYWFLVIVVLLGYLLWWMNAKEETQTPTNGYLPAIENKTNIDGLSKVVDNRVLGLPDVLTEPLSTGLEERSIIGQYGPVDEKTASRTAADTKQSNIASTGATEIKREENENILLQPETPSTQASAMKETIDGDGDGDGDDEESLGTIEENALKFSFINDCWVEVRDRDNKIIFSDLKRAEETLNLLGSAPFRILLGFAPGVSLDYDGKPVNISVNKKDNSARLTVGRS